MHRMRERRDIIGFEQSTLDKAMSLKEDIYLDGFWQSERYFARHAPAIRKEPSPGFPLSPNAERLAMAYCKRWLPSLPRIRATIMGLWKSPSAS
jgi:hypothetical protein